MAVVLAAVLPGAWAQGDGIFAEFTTSMGNFTCQLDYTRAPKATANFIGLATGSRPWVDGPTGLVRTNAYYNGLTFHRVIRNFMIQGGSPNGQGTDGPGYAFPDEFDAALRHDGPGVLSMANSGPNSNGSQFFVTVSSQPHLNDVHTIFGHVTSGQTVVDAINQVATDASSKPLTPVVVQSVVIQRVGVAAQAFDIGAQNLPVVSSVPLGITAGGGQVSLTFANGLYAENFLATSTNLTNWTGASLGVDVVLPATNNVPRAMVGPAQFHALSRVQYPSSTFAPRAVNNRVLTMESASFTGPLALTFTSSTSGTFNYDGTAGTITNYTWIQEIYRGRLWPIYYSTLPPMTLRLDFSSTTSGTFSGTAYTTPTLAISGTFMLNSP